MPAGHRRSWIKVLGRIEELTGYEVGSDDRTLKSDAQWISDFAHDRFERYEFRSRSRLITKIFEFLSHREINKLILSESFQTEPDFSLALGIKSFWSTLSDTEDRDARHLPNLLGIGSLDGKLFVLAIDLSESSDNSIYSILIRSVSQTCSTDEAAVLVYEGLLIKLNGGNIIVFARNTLSDHPLGLAGTITPQHRDTPIMGVLFQERRFPDLNVIPFKKRHSDVATVYASLGLIDTHTYIGRTHPYFLLKSSNTLNKQCFLGVANNLFTSIGHDEVSHFERHPLYPRLDLILEQGIDEKLLRGLMDSTLVEDDVRLFVNAGARFDLRDARTGYTALHAIAHLGWREAFRLALAFKDRCNFAAVDNQNRPASYAAYVYGGDEAMARVLKFHEKRTYNAKGVALPSFHF